MTKNKSLKSFKDFLLFSEQEENKKDLEKAKSELEKATSADGKKEAYSEISKALKDIDPSDLDNEKKEAYNKLADILKTNSSVVTESTNDIDQQIIDLCNIILGIKGEDGDPNKHLQSLNDFVKRANISEDLINKISNAVSHFDGNVIDQIATADNLIYFLKNGKITKEVVALIIALRKFASNNKELFTKSGEIATITFKSQKLDSLEKNPLINTLYEREPGKYFFKLKEKYSNINDLFIKINNLKLSEPMKNLFDSANTITIEKLIQDLDNFVNKSNGVPPKEDLDSSEGDEKKDTLDIKTKSDSELEQEVKQNFANISYGYKTPVVYDFPRDESRSAAEQKILDYFNNLSAEMKNHFEMMSANSKEKMHKNSKILNPDKYWDECIKKAGIYNNTINEGVGRLVFDSAKRGLRNAGKAIANTAGHIATDVSTAANNGVRKVKDTAFEHSNYIGAKNDYKYAGDNKSKGEVRVDNSIETFMDSCTHIIDDSRKRSLECFERSRERVSIDKYYNLISKISNIMQETKSKLKDKENAFKRIVDKGTIGKKIQDAIIDKTIEKDPNKIAYDKEQKEEDIKIATSIFNKAETSNTQRIAKWMLADLLINNSNMTPEQFLKMLETKFTAIKLKGSLHNGMIYEIDDSKIKKITVKNDAKYQIIDFAALQPTAKYETPIALFKASIDEFKDVGVGNLELVKNMKTALKNDTFAKNVEPFKEEMKKYFAARNNIRSFINENSLHLPQNSINTEQYVKDLAESIFGGSGSISMIWEADEQVTTQTEQPLQNTDKYSILEKYKCVTNENLQKLFGNGSGKINFLEHGPEDIAAIQQFAYSSAAMLIDKAENKYYFFNRARIEDLFKELTSIPSEPSKVSNIQGVSSDTLNKVATDVKGKSADDIIGLPYEGAVNTEPQATVTTGAVGDVTIPQRMPTPQDVMKRKLNYTTYTYKNGPITVQKRKYDD